VRRILFSDGLHNIGDGLLLVAAFQVSTAAGISAGVAVFVHEIVQEVSEFFVLRSSGLSVTKALLYNFAVSATILIGVSAGLLAVASIPAIRVPLLGVAGGSFLVVVGHDLIPHSTRQAQSKEDTLVHVGWFLCGVIMMAVSLFAFGH
jgi:zinc transporter ZupT